MLFLMVCMMIIKSAGATKEDLPLDGSLEFYVVTVLVVIVAVPSLGTPEEDVEDCVQMDCDFEKETRTVGKIEKPCSACS